MLKIIQNNSDIICGIGIGLVLGTLVNLTFCIAIFN